MSPAVLLVVTILAAALGGAWRVVLGGANKWAAWSQSVRWLRWCWDFNQEDGQPVLRRSVTMIISPLLCAPVWLAPVPWWVALALTACATVQWVWPGRDFAVWWSLGGAHLLWALASAAAIGYGVAWSWPALLPLLVPVVAIVAYAISLRVDNDRIGQAATGAAVYGLAPVSLMLAQFMA